MVPSSDKEKKNAKFTFFFLLVLFYLFFIYEAVIGNLHFINKPEIYLIIILFLLFTKKTKEFIRDWVLFIGILYTFDALRGFAFYTVVKYHRKYFMWYVLKIEKAILGGKTITNILQSIFWHGKITFFEKFLTSIHASHFLIFLVVGVFIWIDNREKFYQYATGLSVVMFFGILGYILIPTAPPWIASNMLVIPKFERIIIHVYRDLPTTLLAIFDTNPVAAMPSIHAAFPFFIFLFTVKNYRLRYKIISFIYFLLVTFTVTYCGEHYLTDVLTGCVVSIVALFLYPYILPLYKKIIFIDGKNSKKPLKIVFISLLLIFFSSFLGKITNASEYFEKNPDFISMSFIKDELEGKSILSEYYKGEYYLIKKNYLKAMTHSKKAIHILLSAISKCKNDKKRLYLIEILTKAKLIYASSYLLNNYNKKNKEELILKLIRDRKKLSWGNIYFIIIKEGYKMGYLNKNDVVKLLNYK